MKKIISSFSKEQDREIYYACNGLRSIFVTKACHFGLKPHCTIEQKRTIKTINDIAGHKSKMQLLINEHNWEALFKSYSWLSLLKGIQDLQDLDSLDLKSQLLVDSYLKTVIKYFPEETKGHITRVLKTTG